MGGACTGSIPALPRGGAQRQVTQPPGSRLAPPSITLACTKRRIRCLQAVSFLASCSLGWAVLTATAVLTQTLHLAGLGPTLQVRLVHRQVERHLNLVPVGAGTTVALHTVGRTAGQTGQPDTTLQCNIGQRGTARRACAAAKRQHAPWPDPPTCLPGLCAQSTCLPAPAAARSGCRGGGQRQAQRDESAARQRRIGRPPQLPSGQGVLLPARDGSEPCSCCPPNAQLSCSISPTCCARLSGPPCPNCNAQLLRPPWSLLLLSLHVLPTPPSPPPTCACTPHPRG